VSHPPQGITIYAPESNYDSETIKRLSGTFLSSQDQVMVNIHTPNKSQFDNLMKKGKEALKTAVAGILTKDSCVIFVIDRDGPMAYEARKNQRYSHLNQIRKVLAVKEFQGRVHLVEAINEIEAWLLIDCVGIFCYFAKGHHSLPTECKQKNSVECPPACRNQLKQKFNALINSCQKGDTQTIEEPIAGGKGVKEHLQHFAKEIYKRLHDGDDRVPRNKQYEESQSPDIASYIEINSETLGRNESLKRLIELIVKTVGQTKINVS